MLGNWLFHRQTHQGTVDVAFDRPDLLERVGKALSTKKHLIVYGQAKQGKTVLLRKALEGKATVTLTAFPDTTFADIFRTYLMTLGCSVTVESTKKKSLGSKAEVKFPWPLPSPTVSVEGQLEGAVTTHNFTADINSPNDICYLLRQMRSPTALVIDHFEQLCGKQRKLLIDALPMMFENGLPQITLVASTADLPLDYGEQVRLASCIVPVAVPPLSRADSDRFVEHAFANLEYPLPALAQATLFNAFEGSLGLTLDACSLIAGNDVSADVAAVPAEKDGEDRTILTAIHEQTRNYFLAFLSALIEKEWTVSGSFRARMQNGAAATAADAVPDEPSEAAVPIDPVLAGDPVFDDLRTAIETPPAPDNAAPETLEPLLAKATELGKALLARNTDVETTRFLGFALTQFIDSPTDLTNFRYVPSHESDSQEVNLGTMLCELLVNADPTKDLVLTSPMLQDYFDQSNFLVHTDVERLFTKTMKRIRRLKRALRMDTYVFAQDDDLTRCTLWDGRNLKVFGDCRPSLKALLRTLDDDADADT